MNETTAPRDQTPAGRRRFLQSQLHHYPELTERIFRSLLIELHSRGHVSVDGIHQEAAEQLQRAHTDRAAVMDENVQQAARWDEDERRIIRERIVAHAVEAFSCEELEDLVNLTRKREEAESLEEIANLGAVSFGLLARKVQHFCRLPVGQASLTEREAVATRVALTQAFVSDQLPFIGIARRHLRIRDFGDLVERMLGDDEGMGRIGGKAGGMWLGHRILDEARARDPQAPAVPLRLPDSHYLRSDVFEKFIRYNGLQHLQGQKYKTLEEIRNEYPMVLRLFKNADFPVSIVQQVEKLLERIGCHPLIVRSSSLLEDRFETAFAGKYRSVFVANQGPLRDRVQELLGAVAETYASVFAPDPITYRRQHQLLDYDENMAVLIQKLVGTRVGPWFLPVWAGVGFSHNPERRNPRIRPEDGLVRLVFGLGTRAVDRVAGDGPRLIHLGLPTLRRETSPAEMVAASQKQVAAINLDANTFQTVPVADLVASALRIPGAGAVFSTLERDHLRPLTGDTMLTDPEQLLVTFDGFTRHTPYPAFLRWCLRTLEEAYGVPVDVEFAFDGEAVHLLQCRPQARRRARAPVPVPRGIPADRRIFSAHRDVSSGSVHDIDYVVLIDPRDYNRLTTTDQRLAVAQAVHRLNQALADETFILMGPGRWGTRDPKLGIRIGYADINHTRMLIEIARTQGGYVPEVSYGSHFFQDLAEADIHYLPLYPDEPPGEFNDAFLRGSENALDRLLPGLADRRGQPAGDPDLATVVRVIHVPSVTGGRRLRVDMDGERQEALAYVGEG